MNPTNTTPQQAKKTTVATGKKAKDREALEIVALNGVVFFSRAIVKNGVKLSLNPGDKHNKN